MKLFQLKYLLWKNLLIRMQQKIWLAVEFLLPCVMIGLIIGVNSLTTQFPQNRSMCYRNRPTPLPSAGLLPILHSAMCGASSPLAFPLAEEQTCDADNSRGDGNIALWDRHSFTPSTYFDKVSAVLLHAANAPNVSEATRNLLESFHVISSDFNKNGSYTEKIMCGRFFDQYSLTRLYSVVDPIRARFPIKYDATFKVKTFIQRIPKKVNFTCSGNDFNRKTYIECITLFERAFIGGNVTFVTPDGKEQTKRRLVNAPTQLCTLLTGYVLVSPQSPATSRVVHKLNDGLKSLGTLRKLLHYFRSTADQLSASLAGLSYDETVDVLAAMIGGDKQFVRDNLDDELFTDSLLSRMNNELEFADKMFSLFRIEDRFVVVKDHANLLETAACLQDTNQFIGAIDFDGLDSTSDKLPPHTTYKLRMSNMLQIGTSSIAKAGWDYPNSAGSEEAWSYIYYGFNYLQEAVDRTIIAEQTGRKVPVGIYLQPMPTPCFTAKEASRTIVSILTPPLLIFAWSFLAAIIIKNVTFEKEKGLKEYMKVMGLGSIIHWIGWFIQYLVILLISVILFTLLLKFGGIMPRSNPFLIALLFFLFGVSTITQSFLVSAFFNTATKASVLGGFLYFFNCIPAIVLPLQSSFGYWTKMATSTVSQVGLSFGIKHIASWESEGSGIQFSNMARSDGIVGDFTFYSILGMLLFDIVLYSLLTLYVEAVRPGEFGIAKPFYFPFTLHFWMVEVFGCARKSSSDSSFDRSASVRSQRNSANIDEYPDGPKLGVSLEKLRKVYSNGSVAVDGISLNFYESQITSFLGHNGAGKTTTLSILTGSFSQTSGRATVYGHDTQKDMDHIRKSIGMCPQHNILYDMLTVKQQLVLSAGLKGVPSKRINEEVRQIIEDVGLLDKKDQQTSTLSGGMKRKLSIAIALLGGSKTVILDEPTAGVDPFARRGIWDLLIKYKPGKTIILSTHHMDEADILGDRLAVIANGKLLAYGSSLFLKKRFGAGSTLTISRKNTVGHGNGTTVVSAADSSPIEQAVGRLINYSNLSYIGQDMVFTLPPSETEKMLHLCREMDQNLEKLGISGYGISDATMEEVFLKVNEISIDQLVEKTGIFAFISRLFGKAKVNPEEPEEINGDATATSNIDEIEKDAQTANHPNVQKLSGPMLFLWQFIALLIKRFHKFRRNLRGAIVEIILPVSLVALIGLLLTLGKNASGGNSNELLITPWIYGSKTDPNIIFLSYLSDEYFKPKPTPWSSATYQTDILPPADVGKAEGSSSKMTEMKSQQTGGSGGGDKKDDLPKLTGTKNYDFFKCPFCGYPARLYVEITDGIRFSECPHCRDSPLTIVLK